jgi:lipopolysaccharide export system permease protein
MRLLKKIDIYVFKRFSTLLLMTFLICIFILLMQFLWKHFDDLVGKGIGLGVLAEFFTYAIFTIVPLALPLAILLASLMTFGNLGENFELTAMKSAGISLFRIIRPLILLISGICVGAFFFSNDVLPVSQKKLWTLILSLRQKSPELDIPSGEFYSGIDGYNLYVRSKNNGWLKDVMIYDFSGGFNNASVMVADSGTVKFTDDKKYLILSLYNGETFENLRRAQSGYSASNSIPYRRETFGFKEILIDFDREFNRMDESVLKDHNISKNIAELSQSIDTMNKLVESRYREQANEMINSRYFGRDEIKSRPLNIGKNIELKNYQPDTLFASLSPSLKEQALEISLEKVNTLKDQIKYNQAILSEPMTYVNRHQIEWHRKFTLSFACLIFFFIGAPLGAIIRKGGLGTPVVISVIMFIVYYIIDNTGLKMARESIWSPWEGMWLSSAILLPVGIFLTYKAAVDASLFNMEYYQKFLRKIKNLLYKFLKITPEEELAEE